MKLGAREGAFGSGRVGSINRSIVITLTESRIPNFAFRPRIPSGFAILNFPLNRSLPVISTAKARRMQKKNDPKTERPKTTTNHSPVSISISLVAGQ